MTLHDTQTLEKEAPVATPDLLDRLAEITPESELAQARQTRDVATRHTEGSYQALFAATEAPGALTLALRFWLAEQISDWHQDSLLQQYYAERGAAYPVPEQTPALSVALAHARRLTQQPVSAEAADLHTLLDAGWTADDIVTLSQLTAFISFQSRLLRGYRLLSGHAVDTPPHNLPRRDAGIRMNIH